MNGSRPFWVSMCQGFGRARRSETDPCDNPNTDSPNNLWLIEYCDSASLTRRTMSSVLRLLYISNCCWVMGGKTALSGRCGDEWCDGTGDWDISELVIDAMRCSGLAATENSSVGVTGGRIEFPMGLGADEAVVVGVEVGSGLGLTMLNALRIDSSRSFWLPSLSLSDDMPLDFFDSFGIDKSWIEPPFNAC